MKNNKIILDDEYFIEVDYFNWTLKKKRLSPRSKEKIIGHYASLEKAILGYKDKLINKTCLKCDKNVLIDEVTELLHGIESRLNHALGTLKTQLKEED